MKIAFYVLAKMTVFHIKVFIYHNVDNVKYKWYNYTSSPAISH